MDELEIADVLEFPEPRRRCVLRGARGLVGEPAVCADCVDDVGLGRLVKLTIFIVAPHEGH